MATHSTTPHGQARTLRVLVSTASAHGATAEIADEISAALSRHGFAVTMMTPERVRSVGDYDAVIIGSAVYAGHWLDPAKDLVYRSREALARRPVWLFPAGQSASLRAGWPRRWPRIPLTFPGCARLSTPAVTRYSLASSTEPR